MQFWSFMLCIAGVVLVSEAQTCQETAPELYRSVARFAWTGFVLALACIITSMSTAIFVSLVRRGALSTSNAAPTGTLDICKVVSTGENATKEEKELLAPDENEEEQSCPICMEAFGPEKEVRLTPCKHLFHGPCLSGWLQVSRCCPMCRHDFTGAAPIAQDTSNQERARQSSDNSDTPEDSNLLRSRMGSP